MRSVGLLMAAACLGAAFATPAGAAEKTWWKVIRQNGKSLYSNAFPLGNGYKAGSTHKAENLRTDGEIGPGLHYCDSPASAVQSALGLAECSRATPRAFVTKNFQSKHLQSSSQSGEVDDLLKVVNAWGACMVQVSPQGQQVRLRGRFGVCRTDKLKIERSVPWQELVPELLKSGDQQVRRFAALLIDRVDDKARRAGLEALLDPTDPATRWIQESSYLKNLSALTGQTVRSTRAYDRMTTGHLTGQILTVGRDFIATIMMPDGKKKSISLAWLLPDPTAQPIPGAAEEIARIKLGLNGATSFFSGTSQRPLAATAAGRILKERAKQPQSIRSIGRTLARAQRLGD